jgi:hypothetical protein
LSIIAPQRSFDDRFVSTLCNGMPNVNGRFMRVLGRRSRFNPDSAVGSTETCNVEPFRRAVARFARFKSSKFKVGTWSLNIER